jgi:uncharacterized damage-inducible protein DinB
MYSKLQDFIVDFHQESELTLKVLHHLTNESLNTKVYPEGRTLGTIAWHIAGTIQEMSSYLNIEIEGSKENDPVPDNTNDIILAYEKAAKSLLLEIPQKLSDAMLEEEIEIYHEKWKVKFILQSLIKHEIHHRGQITVLMRQAGLRVPGVYGPSKEEWEQYGMEPQK